MAYSKMVSSLGIFFLNVISINFFSKLNESLSAKQKIFHDKPMFWFSWRRKMDFHLRLSSGYFLLTGSIAVHNF